MDICDYERDGFTISTDRSRLDLEITHEVLSKSYWSPGLPQDVMEKAIRNSLCFGLYEETNQIGFARVVTDYARHAYLCDVFVLDSHRGKGLGKWLVQCVVECPLLEGVRSIKLNTRDAHGLYEPFGFKVSASTHGQMVLNFDMPWYRPDLIAE